MSKGRFFWTDYIVAIGVAVIGVGLITHSAAVSQGIQTGLRICAGVLIPALFPFMALSSFLSMTSAASILSIPLAPITTRLFKLPKELGAVVLLSLIGGYPVGAKSISLLLAHGKITKKTAERMLCFCVNSGPSFLITAVGVGMLASKTAGLILFFSQTAATILIGMIVSMRAKISTVKQENKHMKADAAFVAAVSTASSSIIAMCAFAVLFSGVLSFISASGAVERISSLLGVEPVLIKAVVSSILEVTSGCVNAAQLGGETAFIMISAAASFGGLSVLFQIMSCFREHPVSFRPLILARIAHVFLSNLLALPVYKHALEARDVFAASSRPIMYAGTNSLLMSVCLLCMCAIVTLSSAKN